MVREFEKLPKNVVPSHYKLHLKPDLVKFVFEGQVVADLEVKEATQRIVLNSLDLELGHIELQLQDGSLFLPSQVILAVEDETVTIVFASTVPTGPCKLTIAFKGDLKDSLKGFYRSSYTSLNGEQRYCAVTQFESCCAHLCFPCWDEPAIKATFDISLTVPKDRVALSNMPVLTEEDQPEGNRLIHFSRTPVMSTYLVAVVIGEYDFIEDISSDGVRVRVYTPSGKTEQGQFALKVAVKVLPYYKDYFQIAYPLPKIDLITVTNFAAGAMENWGLVTYRESCLLVDPDYSSTQRKQSIALTVAHELAHQWFGNLVTLEWWTHLWLNEGYATFAEFLCVAHIFPKYDIWTQFVTDIHNIALELDSLKNSHPIEVPVGHPAEVDEIFDDISYCKGASVIRMLHNYLGDADFRKGMTLYLNRHLYQNASTEDLWRALEEASRKPVSAVMPTWTEQMGYPMVSVQSEQIGSDRKLKLKQVKFCADGGSLVDGPGSQMWMIPIEITSAKATSEVIHKMTLGEKETEIILKDISENHWVNLNPGAFGFYRVQYSPEMLDKLKPVISDLSLPPLDRLSILNDLFALVVAGHARTDQVFQLLKLMENETHYCVWTCMSTVLKELKLLLQYADEVYPKFLAFGRCILHKTSQSISWDPLPDESHEDKLLRNVLLDLLVAFDDKSALIESQKRFTAHVEGSAPVFPDIRSTVYRAVLKKADVTIYNTFLKLYREETFQEEKNRITNALASMSDKNLLKQLIEFSLSNEVRTQNSLSIVSSVAQTRVGRDLVWEYTKNNWDTLKDKYSGMFMLPQFLKSSLSHFASEEKAQEVEKFCSGQDLTGLERSVQIAIERIRLNAAWLKRDISCVTEYLKDIQ